EEFKKNMGLGASAPGDPHIVHKALEEGGITAKLDNGWTLKPVRFGHERRIELTGPTSFYWPDLMAKGVIKEKGGDSKIRLFVPTGANGAKVLERLANENKIISQLPIGGATTLATAPPQRFPKPIFRLTINGK